MAAAARVTSRSSSPAARASRRTAERSPKSPQRAHASRNGRNGVCADETRTTANDKPAPSALRDHRSRTEEHDATIDVWSFEYTTQECSRRGTLVHKTLSERTPVCSQCGLVLGRDHNAARIILSRGVALLAKNYRGASRKVTLGERGPATQHGRPFC